MGNSREVDELIERVVNDARLATDRERADLRRELESHFAEAESVALTPETAIGRFGDLDDISRELDLAHRLPRVLSHTLRLATALAASLLIAVALQLGANLHISPGWGAVRLGPAFLFSVAFSALIIVGLVAAWELDIEALCAPLEKAPVRLLLTLAGLAATMVLFHALHASILSPITAIVASAVDVAVWACTITILARTDRLFARVFRQRSR